MCPAVSFICSCGTEFTEYKDMLEHSTTHEPGHQVLDHETIKKRRIEKRIEEEEQLKRLQTGEVVWKTPKVDNVPPVSSVLKPMLEVPLKTAYMPQFPTPSPQIPQVPQFYPAMSQVSFLPNPVSSSTHMKNIFAGVGAPTVDLWTLYQPVVLVQTVRKFNKKKPYTCGKCGQGFMTKTSLIFHHSSHVTDKVSGCIGCGLLLSSKKVVPRFHVCNSPSSVTKYKLITARPLKQKPTGTDRSQNLSARWSQSTSSLQLQSQTLSAESKDIQAPNITSTLHLKSENIRTYNRKNQGPQATTSLQLKSQSPSASKPNVVVSPPLKSQNPNRSALNKSSCEIPVTQYKKLHMPINCASGVSSKPMKTPSASNEFTCRVCHIPFETAQLLQRHKCIKAREFLAQHVRSSRQHYKIKRVTPIASQNPARMNGERKLGVPASGNIKKNQVMTVSLDKGQGPVPLNGKAGVEMDNECYIVESGPDKPAEMIYQVTSSVPIKT